MARLLFCIWKSYKFLQVFFELCIDRLLVPSSCSAEHLGKVKGRNCSGNNSNEILEYIERPVIYTSCGEVLCQGNAVREECIGFVIARVTAMHQKTYFFSSALHALTLPWKLDFLKRFVPTGKLKHHSQIRLVALICTA